MLSKKHWLVSACVVVSACDDTSSEYEAPEAIVLECTNELDNGTEREGWVSTIRVYPGNEYQTALQYFHGEDARWFQPCHEAGHQCELAVTSRFIQERDISDYFRTVTEINRTSGRITKTAYSQTLAGADPIQLIDGACVKVREPQESETKF